MKTGTNHGIHEIHGKGNYVKKERDLADDTFVLEKRMMAEVHQGAKFVAGAFEIVLELGAVLVAKTGYGLDLDDDLVKTDRVRLVELSEYFSFIG